MATQKMGCVCIYVLANDLSYLVALFLQVFNHISWYVQTSLVVTVNGTVNGIYLFVWSNFKIFFNFLPFPDSFNGVMNEVLDSYK